MTGLGRADSLYGARGSLTEHTELVEWELQPPLWNRRDTAHLISRVEYQPAIAKRIGKRRSAAHRTRRLDSERVPPLACVVVEDTMWKGRRLVLQALLQGERFFRGLAGRVQLLIDPAQFWSVQPRKIHGAGLLQRSHERPLRLIELG